MLLKRFKAWLLGNEVLLPKEWPEDVWERMFMMGHYAMELQLGPISIYHFDITIEVSTKDVDELFAHLEIMIRCLANSSDVPDGWNDRSRTKWIDPIPDYYYGIKPGYRSPQAVLDIVVEKVMVIHNLIESNEIIVIHPYYSYMRREFYTVVSDVIEVLNASMVMGKLSK